MTKKFSNAEYYAQLPKKQTGTAVLFFNSKSELLIVKPNYKEGWLVPGGAIEDRESPLQGAIREVKEEIGLDIPELKLIGVYYRTGNEIFGDSLKFIFSGGVLNDSQITEIKLQKEELEMMEFVPTEKALSLLSTSLKKSLPACLEAIKNKTVAYIE